MGEERREGTEHGHGHGERGMDGGGTEIEGGDEREWDRETRERTTKE